MEKPDRLWDWLAWLYDRRVPEDEELTRSIERLEPVLGEGDAVLDFGCGSGFVACRIAPGVKEVHGIDTSRRMIALARERADAQGLANARFTRTTIFDEELGDRKWDVVLAFHVLHLLEHPGEAVRRASGLLKPGGLLVSVTPADVAGPLLRALAWLVPRLGLLSHLRTFDVPDLEALLRAGGFALVESEVFEGPIQTWFAVARVRRTSRS